MHLPDSWRMKGLSLTCLTVLFVLGAATPAWAQTEKAQLLQEIWGAYRQLDYEAAEEKARGALKNFADFTPVQLAEIHKALALITYSQGKEEQARQQFEAALSLKPDLVLDPLMVSPKIMAFFEEVKRSVRSRVEAGPPAQVRYILVEDPRPAAALRSAVLPGWGQRYKQEPSRGWVLTGLWGGTASGALATHLLRALAHERYHEARDSLLIQEYYRTYNTWHKVRGGFLLGAAAVWAYSFLDALLTGPPPEDAVFTRRREVLMTPAPAPAYAWLHLRLHF